MFPAEEEVGSKSWHSFCQQAKDLKKQLYNEVLPNLLHT